MIKKVSRKKLRKNRQKRIRKSVFGTPDRLRLVVFRSAKHIYAQVIDDVKGQTITSANSLQKDLAGKITDKMPGLEIAKLVGKTVGEDARKSGIETVVFDRAGYKYHGRVAAVADGAREAGLKL